MTYDTRSREEILVADRYAPFRKAPGFSDLSLRELRTLDRFFGFAEARGITVPSVEDFLAFTRADQSPRKLEDLRTAFDRLLPAGTPARETVRKAIRTKRPGSRICDHRSSEALRADPQMAPYRDLPAFAAVPLEDLRVLARFLCFAAARNISGPQEADYLSFVADMRSSRRLRSLQAALDLLLPGNPAVRVVLAAAIARKSPSRPSRAGCKPRPPAARRLAVGELPAAWQVLLQRMRLGGLPMHQAAPADSVIDSMEECLREYARVQRDAGMPVAITIEGVRRLEAARATHAAAREQPAYKDQGNRPATRHTAVMRLHQFAQALELDPLILAALHKHENSLRRKLASVVPLKFGRLDQLPSLAETWGLASDLLAQSATAAKQQTRLRLLNKAVVIALWTLLPLRLRDGQLLWGRDIRFDGRRYRIDIETAKEEVRLQGALHPVLTPFLDALALRGMDPIWLEELRRRAVEQQLPLFRTTDGRQLAASYPSKVWRQHLGTGAHISRSRVHSELGQLGPEAVTAALALNAQSDPRTAAYYQGKAVRAAQQRRSQDMVDDLLAECISEGE